MEAERLPPVAFKLIGLNCFVKFFPPKALLFWTESTVVPCGMEFVTLTAPTAPAPCITSSPLATEVPPV